ncbi:Bax inhibitor-1/YccA family protein [Psychromonas sp. Urea-02u-13]|jgi:modulator of FtsH protease|uniref:Bax inhibitor-1/YccA family protein n=1 Tax=Psychromonas sp. Urea-02u-13 TaxID=2058326 RepID=UPI000C33C0EE|nr:Bax inhibitor-1/YccA family protein [Psychromonas sp. Urea-02u-13]PKG38900.1 BAX inhibitor protein [Psychromonas sp. Urea-02u-13]
MNSQFTKTHTSSPSISINKVLKNTYILLGMTLAFSALTATIATMMNIGGIASLVLMLVGFGLLFVVSKTADTSKGLFWVFMFTGVMGASLGNMLNHYLAMENGSALIMQALGSTALIFFALSAYALSSKKDFSFMGGFLMTGMIVVVIAMIANIFLQIPMMQVLISSVVVLIMSGFILFDTSRIINGGETNYIRATVSLYLNLFNLFIHLLTLLNILDD